MARFLGNRTSNEFHDLTRERPQCQIAEIAPSRRKEFVPDTLDQAIIEGYEPCFFCLGTVADLLPGAGRMLAAPAGLTGEDLGGGEVRLTWTYPDDIVENSIRFDIYSGVNPLDPFRTLRAGGHESLAITLSGFSEGGDTYFVVIARRGGQLGLPGTILHLWIEPVVTPVTVTAGGVAPGSPPAAPGFPFGIDNKGSVFAQGGDPLLRSKILQLLLTSPGERVCQPEYGTRLRDLVFDPNNEILAATTEFMVTRALQKYLEKEIQVSQVQARSTGSELLVDIVYVRKSDLKVEQVRIGISTP